MAPIHGTSWGTFCAFPQRTPSRSEPCSQSNLLVSSPFTACLPALFPHKPTQASWDHLPKPLCSAVLVSKSAFGNSLEAKYLPQGLLWSLEQEKKKPKPGRMLIQTGDSKTSRDLFFYCTLFTSKFSCTGGWGHFPRWKACPSAAPKRPARAGSSSSAGTILGLGGWRRTWSGENKAAGGVRSLWGHRVLGGTCLGSSVSGWAASYSAPLSPSSSGATSVIGVAVRSSSSVSLTRTFCASIRTQSAWHYSLLGLFGQLPCWPHTANYIFFKDGHDV